jgi:WD40 repeat protein
MPTADFKLDGARSIDIPDHELLRLIGKGSYGEVWLARNIMGTFRAVKIIRRSVFDNQSPFDREFAGIKKFEPISRTHSGFVDILQIGRNEQEGCLYYVMEAADDLDLGQAIDPDRYVPRTLGKALARVKRFPVDQCVQIGLALCQALETLHRHGLVHRDIKPSNIVFVNGVPKLADIGLVTESNNARSFVGTEGFIPPEGPGSECADIYSLGKALYEIASGRDRLDFPALPPDLSEFHDGEQFLELNECLIRACRLDSQKRYSSAREMYEDLALLASGKSLRRLRVLERRWENAKRTAGLAAGVAALAGIIIWPIVRERQHADETRERQIGVRSANGITKLDQDDLPGALREFSEVFHLQAADKRHFIANQTRVASILASAPKLTDMAFLKGRVATVELSADGKRILAVERWKRTRLYDLASGADVLPPIDSPLVVQASFHPTADLAVIADETGFASIWDLKTGKTQKLEHPMNVFCARFSPSGKLIATACRDGITRIWDSATLRIIFAMPGHTSSVRCVAFSPDERLLVSAGTDATARIWDVRTGKQVGPVMRHPTWVVDAGFSPDSACLVTACQDGWARIWKVGSNDELPTLMKHDDVVTRVGFSPDGTMIFTASNDATVCLWDAKTTLPLGRTHVLRHSAGVLSAGFLANGHQLVTGCWDGTVRIWDLAGAELQPQLIEGVVNDSGSFSAVRVGNLVRVQGLSEPDARPIDHPVDGNILALGVSLTGSALAALTVPPHSESALLHIWKPIGSDINSEIPCTVDKIKALEFSPDGSFIAVKDEVNRRPRVHVFDVVSGAEWPLPDALKQNAVIAFHPNKRGFAIGSDQSVSIFENMSATPRVREISLEGNVKHLAFSGDGRRLLVSQNDEQINPKSAVMIEAETGQLTGVEFWHRDGVLQGAFSPDGSRVITGGEDRELIVWNAASPVESLRLLHRQQVRGLAFSADGRWIGSVAANYTARIWDSETGFPITPALTCESNQTQIILLPDHLRFATIQAPMRAWLWTLPRSDLSPDDAVAISHLLNADLRSSGPTDTQQISQSWAALKRKFPDLFRTNQKQITHWHEKQLRLAAMNHQPHAVAFHRAFLEKPAEQTIEDQTSSRAETSQRFAGSAHPSNR